MVISSPGSTSRMMVAPTMPVVAHGDAVVQIYVDEDLDLDQAVTVVDNAKTRRYEMTGDLIVGIDDQSVRVYDDIYRILDMKAPGEIVQLHLKRDGQALTLPIELQLIAPTLVSADELLEPRE